MRRTLRIKATKTCTTRTCQALFGRTNPHSGRGGRRFKSSHPDQELPASAAGCVVERLISLYGEGVNISQLQDIIERTYGERDRARGVPSTVAWLAEEVGELAQAVRKGNLAQQEHEFGDVLAWVATLANQMGVDLDKCVARYANGCPTCSALPCTC